MLGEVRGGFAKPKHFDSRAIERHHEERPGVDVVERGRPRQRAAIGE
jgi:hypothetical protein